MDRVPAFDLQTPWDCRWTRLAPLAVRHATRRQDDVVWVCVRDGGRRYVSDEECESCASWQPIEAD